MELPSLMFPRFAPKRIFH